MTTAAASVPHAAIDEATYKRRIWAWTMYDWANSAFATIILAAVLPIYYSQVAGATLPSEATATAYWTLGLSLSLLVAAILSPILGTVSDIMRGKKRFLALFAAIGIVATGLLVLVETGDWILASALFIFGRIGFTSANVFYDALLQHVAKEEDQDMVSSRGYAMGYLGGGILLAINVGMIYLMPGTWGARLSFLSVAIWWAVFSIPLFLQVPEPPAATAKLAEGVNVVRASLRRIAETLRDMRQYRELFKYLIAFLIYNDGIGTIIGVAAIYGAELGFGTLELILALLLVQFVGIPFSLIFGRLPNPAEQRRPLFLAFIVFNLVALPVLGILGARVLPADITGVPPAPYVSTANAVGEGIYLADAISFSEHDWQKNAISAELLGTESDVIYASNAEPGARYDFAFNGQQVEITYSTGSDHGIWAVEMDGEPLRDASTGEAITIDAYSPTVRYGVHETFSAPQPGEHILSVANSGEKNDEGAGAVLAVAQIQVLPPIRQNSLPVIIGLILVLQAIGVVFAYVFGHRWFSGLAETLNTKRSILLALTVYSVIAIWGFFLDSTIEFWFLAWMVALVQGGSQALSRSLYASMSPASKSGEFFGLYGVMEKFSSIIGPLLFALAVAAFDSSRPAVLSIILLFLLGGFLLSKVNVEEGRRVAKAEDTAALATIVAT